MPILSSRMMATAVKRDSLTAELERDPQFSTAKRHHFTQLFANSLLFLWKQMEAKCKSLRTQGSDSQETKTDLQNAHSQLPLSTAQTISSQKSLLNSLTSRTFPLKSELAATQSLTSSCLESIHSLQDQLDELQEAKDEWMRGVNDQQDLGVVQEELKWQAEYLRQVEGTNVHLNAELVMLHERHVSIEVLRKQNRSLESKLTYTKASTNTAIPSSQPSIPLKVPTMSETHTLASLHLSHATLLEQHDLTFHCSSLKAELEAEKEGRRKDDVRACLAECEVGFLKTLVVSYQAEELAIDELKVDELKVQRINDLETLSSDHKSTLTSLLSPSTTPPSSPSKPTQPSPSLLAELESLKSKFSDTEKTNEEHLETINKLEQELFELSGEIAGGRHVPPKTRVLQLIDNPKQQWFDLHQSTMDKLKEENSALLK
ncbi:hypothetical protein AN958_10822 [Leucoagaricus sp. SymC.cos]|nr:hypothetical protein AN958_10822 [Leucoagaricus sp. SymC.cos]